MIPTRPRRALIAKSGLMARVDRSGNAVFAPRHLSLFRFGHPPINSGDGYARSRQALTELVGLCPTSSGNVL